MAESGFKKQGIAPSLGVLDPPVSSPPPSPSVSEEPRPANAPVSSPESK